jgi:hypothetical protein
MNVHNNESAPAGFLISMLIIISFMMIMMSVLAGMIMNIDILSEILPRGFLDSIKI